MRPAQSVCGRFCVSEELEEGLAAGKDRTWLGPVMDRISEHGFSFVVFPLLNLPPLLDLDQIEHFFQLLPHSRVKTDLAQSAKGTAARGGRRTRDP